MGVVSIKLRIAIVVSSVWFGAFDISAVAAQQASGMEVHVDPNTGEFVPPPAGSSQPRAARPAAAVPAPVETMSDLPGGGFELDLTDQPQHTMHADLDAEGQVHTGCAPDRPAGPVR